VNDPNEVASPEGLAKLLAMSKYFMVNLDLGHFADGGNYPMKYFTAHHDPITHIHVKDVKSIGGELRRNRAKVRSRFTTCCGRFGTNAIRSRSSLNEHT
jgi:sugar phosphate isomerase/epimerase